MQCRIIQVKMRDWEGGEETETYVKVNTDHGYFRLELSDVDKLTALVKDWRENGASGNY